MLPNSITNPISHPLGRSEMLKPNLKQVARFAPICVPLFLKNDGNLGTDILAHELRDVDVQNSACQLFSKVEAIVERVGLISLD